MKIEGVPDTEVRALFKKAGQSHSFAFKLFLGSCLTLKQCNRAARLKTLREGLLRDLDGATYFTVDGVTSKAFFGAVRHGTDSKLECFMNARFARVRWLGASAIHHELVHVCQQRESNVLALEASEKLSFCQKAVAEADALFLRSPFVALFLVSLAATILLLAYLLYMFLPGIIRLATSWVLNEASITSHWVHILLKAT